MELGVVCVGPVEDCLEELEALPVPMRLLGICMDYQSMLDQGVVGKDVVVLILIGHTDSEVLTPFIDHLPNLKWVHTLSTGVNYLTSCKALCDRKDQFIITNAKGVYSSSLAEYVLAACSYFNKDIRRLQRNREARHWDRFTMGEMRGKTMGIVGYGEIGSKVARLAKAYGMVVVAMRRHRELSLNDPLVDTLLGMDSLPALMECSDFVVVSAALTPATTNLIDAAMLSRMKVGSVIVNIGRGPIINEEGLVNALSEGVVFGAALDVFTVEPLPADSKLWSLPNVLISPHNADKTETARKESVVWFLTLCPAFLQGTLTSSVDPIEGY